jgi:hypothetical protein
MQTPNLEAGVLTPLTVAGATAQGTSCHTNTDLRDFVSHEYHL